MSFILVAKLLYDYLCPSDCMSYCQGLGETRFSPSLIKLELRFFSMQIPLIHEHLFCKYFVRQSCYKRQKCLNKETSFSRRLYTIKVWFFCEDLSYWCASILWIYCPSVCPSGYKKHKCIYIDKTHQFLNNRVMILFVKIYRMNEYLFFRYIFSGVCRLGYKSKSIL